MKIILNFFPLLIVVLVCTGSAYPQDPSIPDWQKAAGGTMPFDVASVRPAAPGQFTRPSFELSPGDSYHPTGGEFVAVFPLSTYIQFAYKLWLTPSQLEALFAHFPDWTRTQSFTIQARGPANATKDQMRLMMQSLLAERFGLKVHFETRETRVLVMTLASPGKSGPRLHPHSEGAPCDKAVSIPPAGTVPSIFPLQCKEVGLFFDGTHPAMLGSRDTTLELIALALSDKGELERPIIDRTGLTGRYDFTLTWAFNPEGAALAPDSTALQAPSFLEAVKEQLGMNLKSARLPMQVLVIDKVQQPSAN